jgi:hypothetical protein
MLLLTESAPAPAAVLIETRSGQRLFTHRVAQPIQSARLLAEEGRLYLITGRTVLPTRAEPSRTPAVEALEFVALGLDGKLVAVSALADLRVRPKRLQILASSTGDLLSLQANDRVVHYRLP